MFVHIELRGFAPARSPRRRLYEPEALPCGLAWRAGLSLAQAWVKEFVD